MTADWVPSQISLDLHAKPILDTWALVHLANGGEESPHTFSAALSAARHEWGQLFT
jgi:hypothetical protein